MVLEKKEPLILKGDSCLDAAVKAFMAGGIIAYPTETFYGLGVNPFDEKAIKRLFDLKGRQDKSPIAVIAGDLGMLSMLTDNIPPLAERLIKRFWPGPLTILFKAKGIIPAELIAGTGKIGVRVSSNTVAMRLLEAINSPITATSANPTGKPPALCAKDVISYFNGGIDVLIDGGRLFGQKGSTIVDATEDMPKIIREGEIRADEVMGVF